MKDKEPLSRAERQRITLQGTYVREGRIRYLVRCADDCYDVSDREFRLLQWGRCPRELGLRPRR